MGSQPPLIRSNLYIITYVINLPTENSVGVAIPNPPPYFGAPERGHVPTKLPLGRQKSHKSTLRQTIFP